MRAPSFLLSAALLLAASTASAVVNEPNGLAVPLNSMNGETQLFTYFASIGEAINWQADAAATPGSFSPLCGFTATFVLHQAGCNLGLAWYNETGVQPTAANLHVIIPANSPLNTTFTGTDIKNDPAYLGGLVGFALVGGGGCPQTHYSNKQWNQVCTACNPQAPWISAVMYASKNQPNAYFIAFEDGSTSGSSFNNDGDFNDAVFFLTGITCNGGGVPCDTGLPGICAPGLTQCTPNGIVCQQLTQAAVVETCNGLDDTCDGASDEGEICPAGFVCDKGTCVQGCNNGEFGCPPDKVCNADAYCVDPACKDVLCPSGEVCVDGLCKGPCDGVICPYPDVCRVGACVDPCDGVTCSPGQVCDKGVCVTDCTCTPCAPTLTCDPGTGICIDPTCLEVPCAAGTHCVAGACIDACSGAVCPSGQECLSGECVPVTSNTGGAGSTGAFAVGVGGDGGFAPSTGGGGHGGAGHGGSTGSSQATGGGTGDTGGCGCRTTGSDAGDLGALAAGAALALAGVRRRRRQGR